MSKCYAQCKTRESEFRLRLSSCVSSHIVWPWISSIVRFSFCCGTNRLWLGTKRLGTKRPWNETTGYRYEVSSGIRSVYPRLTFVLKHEWTMSNKWPVESLRRTGEGDGLFGSIEAFNPQSPQAGLSEFYLKLVWQTFALALDIWWRKDSNCWCFVSQDDLVALLACCCNQHMDRAGAGATDFSTFGG